MDRLRQQLAFLVEIDKLKGILRRNHIADGSRPENDAEHSWHFAVAALVLRETAAADIDLLKVLKMALIHDVVEVDAGDTFIYDTAAQADQAERETRAAERLFGLLPEDQAQELRGLWQEFEERRTPEARYARAIDRLAALLLNYASEGKTWRQHGISKARLLAVNQVIELGSPVLWSYVRGMIEEAVQRGYVDR
jgi:putative hydrolase of HD superfamily